MIVLGVAMAVSPLPSSHASAEPPRYKIIVNATPGTRTLSRNQIADYFLKRVGKWPDGTGVTVTDLSATSAVRAAFCKEVLGQSTESVVNYWQRQILSGRNVPPLAKQSDDAVVAFVASTPGAIGYVGSGVSLPSGVSVVRMIE